MTRTLAGGEGEKQKNTEISNFHTERCFYSCFQGSCTEVLTLCCPYHHLGSVVASR